MTHADHRIDFELDDQLRLQRMDGQFTAVRDREEVRQEMGITGLQVNIDNPLTYRTSTTLEEFRSDLETRLNEKPYTDDVTLAITEIEDEDVDGGDVRFTFEAVDTDEVFVFDVTV